MSTQLKAAIIGALVAVGVLVAVLISELSGTPVPQPSPSTTASPVPTSLPSPSSSVSPLPSPSPSSSTPSGASLFGVVGEAIPYEFTAASAVTLPSIPGLKLELLRKYQVTTTTPSFKGAVVGAYDDPLVPVASTVSGQKYWLDITPSAPGTYTVMGVTVQVKPNVMSWKMPFYSELTFQAVSQAHGLADDGSTLAMRGALNAQYRALLRAHGVEPVKQAITLYPTVTSGALDTSQPFPGNGVSFQETVLNGAIAPPCMFGPAPGNPPSTALLSAIDAAIVGGKLPVGTFAYECDESNCSSGVIQNIKSGAPHLLGMATQLPNSGLGADQYYPVINFWPWAGAAQGMYFSCMSSGCGNGGAYPPTPYPNIAIESPHAQLRAFAWIAKHIGVPRGLYYDSVYSLSKAWQAGGQFAFGTNGDGNFLYPGITGQNGLPVDQPIASIRLKEIRRGLQDVWYLSQGKPFTDPVTSPNVYPQTDAAYEVVRKQIWDQL